MKLRSKQRIKQITNFSTLSQRLSNKAYLIHYHINFFHEIHITRSTPPDIYKKRVGESSIIKPSRKEEAEGRSLD